MNQPTEFYISMGVFVFAVFAAVYLLARAVVETSEREKAGVRASERIEFLETLSPFMGVVRPIARQMLAMMSTQDIHQLEKDLVDAGLRREISLEEFIGLRLIASLGATILGFFMFCVALGFGVMTLAMALAMGLMGFAYPPMWLAQQAKTRKEKIFRGLSNTLDILSISVQAGLDVREALERVTEIGSEPELDNELNQTIQEINKGGKSLTQGFEDFRERVNMPEVTAFCNVLLMAFQLGSAGMGDILGEQADAIRTERVLRAERIASELPAKILFPIAVFIFPAVIVTILGPMLLRAYLDFAE